MRQGKVYLVGAGPGDPGLITVKGLDCLRQADVVVYDRLVNESLLDETGPETEKIYVGKTASHHLWRQEAINELLLKKTRETKVVVRLKGGDPFVLGRGGEEAEFLAMNCIPFEVVPGVSSAYAVPAYAGIPVTRRGLASSFTVVTGHKAFEDKGGRTVAWDKVSTGADTLVILMGLTNLSKVIDELIKNNRDPSTPVAVISYGTSHRQRCVTGMLQSILAQVESQRLEPPAVVVVGEVVRLRKQLRWFDNQALFGKCILVHRTSKQPSRLSQLLRRCGAIPIEVPPIHIAEAVSGYKQMILTKKIDIVTFTNCSTVTHLVAAMNREGEAINDALVACIGPQTAVTAAKAGLKVHIVARKHTIPGLVEAMEEYFQTG